RSMLSNMTKSNSATTCLLVRMYSTQPQSSKTENTNVGHARFLAEAEKDDLWKKGVGNAQKGGIEGTGDELDGISPGKGGRFRILFLNDYAKRARPCSGLLGGFSMGNRRQQGYITLVKSPTSVLSAHWTSFPLFVCDCSMVLLAGGESGWLAGLT
ncbi:2944_t:CDS:2, partial [Acaulospora colombiana]